MVEPSNSTNDSFKLVVVATLLLLSIDNVEQLHSIKPAH